MTRPDSSQRAVLAADLPRPVILDALRQGTARRLRRGAYLIGGARDDERHAAAQERDVMLARIDAVSRQLGGSHWFCGTTAALVWGLPLWTGPRRVHVVQSNVPGRGASHDLVRHRMVVAPEDLTVVAGLPVTGLERTVLDCARTLPAREGLVVADAALRRGVDRDQLTERITTARGRGLVRARAVLEAADDGAESPGESVARCAVLRHGLPAPQTQIVVPTRLGRFRADMGWEVWRLLLEYDGMVKYRELAGGDPARVVFEEKRRQEAIEEEGWRVLRVTGPDLGREERVAARVRRLIPPGMNVPDVARPGLW